MKGLRIARGTSAPLAAPPTLRRRLRLIPDAVVHAVDRRFLSVAIDLDRVLGWGEAGPLDLDRASLVALARALAPAYLRVGGPLADRTFYAPRGRSTTAPAGFDATLTAAAWDAVVNFAQDADYALMFTLNAGPATRHRDGGWRDHHARLLLDHATARRDPVLVWTLGHELNTMGSRFGPAAPTPAQYAQDLRTAAQLVHERSEGSLLCSAGCRFWPETGERNPHYWSTLAAAADVVDVIAWHYCPLLDSSDNDPWRKAPRVGSAFFDEVATWSRQVERIRDVLGAHETPVWLAEAGLRPSEPMMSEPMMSEPMMTDASAAAMWWVDHLGLLARGGQKVVVRQPLLSPRADPGLGLIDERSLTPVADFWVSILWKRLMGREVLAPSISPDDRRVRVYAHWTPPGDGIPESAVTVLAINLSDEDVALELEGLPIDDAIAFRVAVPSSAADAFVVNGAALTRASDGTLGTVTAVDEHLDRSSPTLTVEPRSFAFFVLAPTGASFQLD